MSWVGAVILYVTFFFVMLLMILPRGVVTQLEDGKVVPGTPGGAPAEIRIRRKFLYAALLALIPVAALWAILEFQLLTLDDFDFLYPESFRHSPVDGSLREPATD